MKKEHQTLTTFTLNSDDIFSLSIILEKFNIFLKEASSKSNLIIHTKKKKKEYNLLDILAAYHLLNDLANSITNEVWISKYTEEE